jgi:magnesium transporter
LPWARQTGLETAASHASTLVPVCAPESPVGTARRALANRRFDSAAAIAVCDGERLVGIVRFEDLLAASDNRAISEIMDADPPVVAAGIDREVAA